MADSDSITLVLNINVTIRVPVSMPLEEAATKLMERLTPPPEGCTCRFMFRDQNNAMRRDIDYTGTFESNQITDQTGAMVMFRIPGARCSGPSLGLQQQMLEIGAFDLTQ
eukprot:TRINITY_DN1936_c0_g1_i1.p1 TRINITY_DN1936_c0_g1~~TRINITY_DN1936_c0_g1_i1.p1  ORF type:complete len:110 (-),score=32.33 TRINITY_DN1936_c0_g1_i1:161-490(-)